MQRIIILPLVALVALAGCAQRSSRFPSLLPRAIESRDDAEPMPAAPAIIADPALDARVAAVDTALVKIRTDFEVRAARAQQLAESAKGQPAGSDAWLDAQSALADLDVVRSDVSSLISDLERMAIDRAAAGNPAYPALEVLRGDAKTQHDDEGVVIDTLGQQLAPA